MKFEEMTYDQQREFLGLPNVSVYVLNYRLGSMFRGVSKSFGEFADVFQPQWERFAQNMQVAFAVLPPDDRPQVYGLAGSK